MTPTLAAGTWDGDTVLPVPAAHWTADEAVHRLFGAHYHGLVRLAALLLADRDAAEEVVQDAFVALHGRWGRLRDPDRAVGYLRQSVINRCRSAQRHRQVVERYVPAPLPHAPSAEAGALNAVVQDEMAAALRELPPRQREALVLRYYADLSEADSARLMGVSRGAVKSHTARGIAALRRTLERS